MGGIAGDLLGGGAQFVDRRGHAGGALGLDVGLLHGRLRGLQHPAGALVEFAGALGHVADRGVDARHEVVEGLGQGAEFVAGLHRQAAGQIALAFGDVVHGAGQVMQRAQQDADEEAQQQDDGDHRHQGGDDGQVARLGHRGIGLGLVDGQGQVPLDRGQARDRGKAHQPLAAVLQDVMEARGQGRGLLREDLLERFQHLVGVAADQDLAVAVHQEGFAQTAGVQRGDHLHQAVHHQVAGHHADQLAVLQDRRGDGDAQKALRRRGQVGFGEDGTASADRGLVPVALAGIVTGLHGGMGAVGEGAVDLSQVGGIEVARVELLFQQAHHVGRAAVAAERLGLAVDQLDPRVQPVGDVAGGDAADLAQRGFETLGDGLALQIGVEAGEAGQGQGHHQGGRQQDLVAELERAFHGYHT